MKLLFIPGSACGQQSFALQVAHFPDSEVGVLPGHPEGEACPSVAAYVEWLREYVTSRGYRDIVMAGHSMGGAVALLYAIRYADLKGLILINTGARLRIHPDILQEVVDMTNAPGDVWTRYLEARHATSDVSVRDGIISERAGIGPAVLLNDFRACDAFDAMAEVEQVRIPTLVIGGRDDELTPVKYAHYLADHIEGASEVIISGAGHWTLTEQPVAVNQAIAGFLDSLR